MNKTTVDRLASFARLWGKVYLFHPAVGRNQVDLHRPTVRAIGSILEAKDRAGYVDAVGTFLRVLKDPSTKIEEPSRDAASSPRGPKIAGTPEWHLTKDGIAVLCLSAFESLGDEKWQRLMDVIRSLDGPKGVVLDARDCGWVMASWVKLVIRNLIPVPIITASTSWRRHSGFTSEGISSGGYYSSIETSQATEIAPTRRTRKRPVDCPIIILADGRYQDPVTVGNALWYAGLGGLVLEGEADFDLAMRIEMAGGVRVKLRVGEWINPDGSVGFQPTVRVPVGTTTRSYLGSSAVRAALRLAREPKPIPKSHSPSGGPAKAHRVIEEPSLPDKATRIFAWFKYWNVIKYFFPYHDLTDRPWDDALTHFLPLFARANTPAEYALAAAEAATWMDDSHAGISGPGWQEVVGNRYVHAQLRRIEDRFVVTSVSAQTQSDGLLVGDIIEAVDGVPVEDISSRLRSYLAHSTEQAFNRTACEYLLGGSTDSVQLTIRRGKSESTVDVPRHASYWSASREGPVFKVLPEGFGYVDLVRLDPSDVDKMLRRLKEAPALIIDIRGYPHGAMFSLAPHLTSKKVVGALFARPEVTPTIESSSEIRGEPTLQYRFSQTIHPAPKLRYEGPIVVLIDERAVSHSEHSCLFAESVADVTFVGTPTMGANGDVTSFLLPGRMMARFTGHEVRHADGRQLQRIGILPDIKVEPTIEGIRSGVDEVLKAAVAHLEARLGTSRRKNG